LAPTGLAVYWRLTMDLASAEENRRQYAVGETWAGQLSSAMFRF
jgi:hypothetical protein